MSAPWFRVVERGRNGGRFFPQDSDGWIVNDLDQVGMQPEWSALVDDTVAAIVGHMVDHLDAIYLRGSVAEGRARKRTSDLDIIVLGSEAPKGLGTLVADLERAHPVAREIAIDAFRSDQVRMDPDLAYLRVVLKAQARLLRGTDIRPYLPRVRPGRDMVFGVHNLGHRRLRLAQALEHPREGRAVGLSIQSFFRAALRSGFELLESSLERFTRDIDLCADLLVLAYPSSSALFESALDQALAPNAATAGVTADAFMAWFTPEYECTFLRDGN